MNLALESALSHFRQKEGELLVGDRTISSVAQEHGTPLYIYDRHCIEWRHKTLRDLLPKNLEIRYAVKANPNVEIVRIMGQLYDGLDIASKGEMERGIEAGISTGRMNFAGPGKRIDELHFAIENNIGGISVESPQELEHIQRLCRSLQKTAHVLMRVNPPFELTLSGMKMGGGPKQFGVDSDRVPALLESMRNDPHIQLEGIHVFAGSQNLEASSIIQAFRKIAEYAVHLSVSMNLPFRIINMGGGFGIPYYALEKELDLSAIGRGLKELMRDFSAKLPDARFVIELGRFLVGECGIYLTGVLYRKVSRGKAFLITDGGMHHHLAASGNLGQGRVKRTMPMTIPNKLHAPLEKVTVVGSLCTPLDTFGTVELPEADEGDLLAVMNSGAYGFSASPLAFLSHEPPKEILI